MLRCLGTLSTELDGGIMGSPYLYADLDNPTPADGVVPIDQVLLVEETALIEEVALLDEV